MKLNLERPAKAKFASAIDAELYAKVRQACKENRVSIKTALEFGLNKFLAELARKKKSE